MWFILIALSVFQTSILINEFQSSFINEFQRSGLMKRNSNMEEAHCSKASEPENETDSNSTRTIQDTQHLVPDVPRRKLFYLEPVMFVLFFARYFIETLLPNMIQAQYCSAILHRPQADCHLDTTNTTIPRNEIETFTATFQMLRTLIENAIPCLQTFFIGPWSDIYGRKSLLISSTIGILIRFTLYTWASTIPTLSPMYFIIFSIPFGICGGGTSMFLGSTCYICDITTTETRTTRLGILHCCVLLGITAGVQLAPQLGPFGYTTAFAVASAITLISLLYLCFILPESVARIETNSNVGNKNPFSFSHIHDLIDNCYTKQTKANRLKIFLTILIIFIAMVAEIGGTEIMYVFLQTIMRIQLSDYASYLTYVLIEGGISVPFIILIFTHLLKMDDLYLLSLAMFIRLLGALGTAFGYRLWHIYVSSTLNNVSSLTGILTQSYLSKIIPREQLGKVFSLSVSAGSATPVIGSLIYTGIFNWTIATFPGTVYLLSGFFMLTVQFLVIVLIKLSETPTVN